MTAKEKAVKAKDLLENNFKIISQGWDIGESYNYTGIIGSVLYPMYKKESQQCAILAVKNEYHSLREMLFNLKSSGVQIPEKYYLYRIQSLIDEEQEIINEIQKI